MGPEFGVQERAQVVGGRLRRVAEPLPDARHQSARRPARSGRPARQPRLWYRVLLGSTGFYRNILGFTGFYWVCAEFLPSFTGFYWVYTEFTGFYWVLLGFSEFYLVLPSFTKFYWVLMSFTGFYWFSPTFLFRSRGHVEDLLFLRGFT